MPQDISRIKSIYEQFERELMKKGKLPMYDTGIGFWNGSHVEEIFELFKSIKLDRFKSFIDLGSGDGRVVLMASLFTNAFGIEYDKTLVEKAHEVKKLLGIQNADFLAGNFYKHDISGHDVVFVSPDTPFHRGLEKKMLKELNGKLIVHGVHFHPTMLLKENEFWINNNFSAVYRNSIQTPSLRKNLLL